EAVFARNISSMKEKRVAASQRFSNPVGITITDRTQFLDDIANALLASKIVSYAQGFEMIEAAGIQNKWKLHKGSIALMWRAGCIIRSKFLGNIRDAFAEDPKLENLLLAPWFTKKIQECESGWRRVVSTA